MGNKRWKAWLEKEKSSEYFQAIMKRMGTVERKYLVYPERENWLRAIEFESVEDIHIVMVGSQPMVKPYEADGLAFSSLDGASKDMYSLYRAIYRNTGVIYNQNDHRKDRWLEQGVLLLNMELTGISNLGKTHDTIWEPFTYRVLQYLLYDKQERFFLLLDEATPWMILDNPYKHPVIETTPELMEQTGALSQVTRFYRRVTGEELDLS